MIPINPLATKGGITYYKHDHKNSVFVSLLIWMHMWLVVSVVSATDAKHAHVEPSWNKR